MNVRPLRPVGTTTSLYSISFTPVKFLLYHLLFYDTLKWVVLTSLSTVCMVIVLIHELVLLHAFEPFLSSCGSLYTVYSKQN